MADHDSDLDLDALTLGDVLRLAREERRLQLGTERFTTRQIADEIGIPQGTYSKYENDLQRPRLPHQRLIQAYLRIDTPTMATLIRLAEERNAAVSPKDRARVLQQGAQATERLQEHLRALRAP